MFDAQKNSERLENVDYVGMMKQARQERAKYLAMLFKGLLSDISQLIERPPATSEGFKQQTRANKSI